MAERSPIIRSGGQSGVDRAALDAAIETRRPYAGWCPKGGWAEDYPEPPGLLRFYPRLKETPSRAPQERTEWNVRDSALTLILVPGAELQSEGTALAIACGVKYGRPCHIVRVDDELALDQIRALLVLLDDTDSLNVAGPRESECPGIYTRSRTLLVEAFR